MYVAILTYKGDCRNGLDKSLLGFVPICANLPESAAFWFLDDLLIIIMNIISCHKKNNRPMIPIIFLIGQLGRQCIAVRKNLHNLIFLHRHHLPDFLKIVNAIHTRATRCQT